MNDANFDEIGIRITPPNLVFYNGQSSRWFGSGILNKPIGDFFDSDDRDNLFRAVSSGDQTSQIPYFTRWINTEIHSRVIPEPSSMALVAGLIVLLIVVLKNAYEKRNGK